MTEGKAKKPPLKPGADGIVRLSGGNPQISKGYGDEVVQRYIAAMPGWQSAVGRKLDTIIEKTVPGVQKAVKWNTPLYGLEQDVYFVSYHCMTKYVKVAFHNGSQLEPKPPGTSRQAAVRYLDIYENDVIDEDQFADWVKQASRLPGEKL